MDERTYKALKGSIKKWKGVAKGTIPDHGVHNCPLCVEFHHGGVNECEGCPVSEHTGTINCSETPYSRWYHHQSTTPNHGSLSPGYHIVDGCDECKKLVKKEVKFLKSLLPEKTPELKMVDFDYVCSHPGVYRSTERRMSRLVTVSNCYNECATLYVNPGYIRTVERNAWNTDMFVQTDEEFTTILTKDGNQVEF